MNILVADDSLFVRTMIAGLLRQLGHVVVGEATTGREAVELADARRPDLVLLDVAMPDGDGIDALGEIRRRQPEVLAVICSMLRSRERTARVAGAGGAVWLAKPVDAARLDSALTLALLRWTPPEHLASGQAPEAA